MNLHRCITGLAMFILLVAPGAGCTDSKGYGTPDTTVDTVDEDISIDTTVEVPDVEVDGEDGDDGVDVDTDATDVTGDDVVEEDMVEEDGPAICSYDGDCDNGVYCDGAETCSDEGYCEPPVAVDCSDSDLCTVDLCDEEADVCTHETVDADSDGYGAASLSTGETCDGTDCNDGDVSINPGATEVVGDGIDQDCSGTDSVTCYEDLDLDGYGTTEILISVDDDCDDAGESDVNTDCDDDDDEMHPEAAEQCDLVDSDCDGSLLDALDADDDFDGHLDVDCGGDDCNDEVDSIYTGATEIPDDGIDQDCSGTDSVTCYEDLDADGYGSDVEVLEADGDCTDTGESALTGDCDDDETGINPGETEILDDGIDQDCSGTDSVTCYEDLDLDGFGTTDTVASVDDDCTDAGESELSTDCDDEAGDVYPGASEGCDGTVDNDCDGDTTDVDSDLDDDGHAPVSCGGDDCDDADEDAYPGAPETPDDGIDQDCNGHDTVTCYTDLDDDGYGTTSLLAADGDCTDAGEADLTGDCDDADEDAYPGAPETPDDGIDQDCSGTDTVTCHVDADHDGYGSTVEVLSSDGDCTDVGESSVGTDCNDGSAAVHPGAPDLPDDGIDQDCNGHDTVTCFVDADHDGYGSTVEVLSSDGDCTDVGESSSSTDCDDAAASVHPGAVEVPDDGIDQDCNDHDTVTCYTDLDGDGYGTTSLLAADGDCTDAGEADLTGDCDDADEDAYPGAVEVPDDGIDQDCNGHDTVTCFVDADHDGYGSTVEVLSSDGDCTDVGESSSSTDCDDAAASVHPGAVEVPDDGIDQDCNGHDTVTCFEDADHDTFGSTITVLAPDGDCTDVGESSSSTDCDDAAASVHPGGVEVPDDGIDQDCNGHDTVTCFVDADHDTFGSTITVLAPDGDCTDVGESSSSTDCNDAAASVHPGAVEVPDDGIDQDCNGHDTITCFRDDDHDGFGSTSLVLAPDGDCTDMGEATTNTDCDDAIGTTYPGAPELCDLVDQDCDLSLLDHADIDDDSDGVPDATCGGNDCDDDVASIHGGFVPGPGIADPAVAAATEDCDLVDQDCDLSLLDHADIDDDSDGVPDATCGGNDCDDDLASIHGLFAPPVGVTDPAVGPAAELCDMVDQDCDLSLLDHADIDDDDDKVPDVDCGGTDCIDTDPATHPAYTPAAPLTDPAVSVATELCDMVDQDCDHSLLDGPGIDTDVDGVPDTGCGGTDCDDTDETIHGAYAPPPGITDPPRPMATESCDEVDQDCDGSILDHADADNDGDGVLDENCGGNDCEDMDETIHGAFTPPVGVTDPAVGLATELCDMVDQDCDLSILDGPGIDDDGDDVPDTACGGTDCMDDEAGTYPAYIAALGLLDPDVIPAAAELCDLIDQDCNGHILEGPGVDDDHDGVPDSGCGGNDCDDADDTIHGSFSTAFLWVTDPDVGLAADLCDLVDQDCDLSILDGAGVDDDHDGVPDSGCGGNDCDDDAADVYGAFTPPVGITDPPRTPHDEDGCDIVDNDCDLDAIDGIADDDDDDILDGDPLGDDCGGTDCDDDDATKYPDAPEFCDGVDRDCDLTWDVIVPDVCHTIQDALTAGSSTGVKGSVMVRDGVYAERLDFHGADLVVYSENGKDVTTIDGDTVATPGPVVRFDSGEGTSTVLDGFTITGGSGNWDGTFNSGGGIYVRGASPTLMDLDVTGNRTTMGAGRGGGGIYLADSAAVLTTCRIFRNSSHRDGGGIYLYNSDAVELTNVTISDNLAVSQGGGLFIFGSDIVIDGLILAGNRATGGGGICFDSSAVRVLNASMVDNDADTGGAIYTQSGANAQLDGAIVSLSDCVTGQGTAVYNLFGSNVIFFYSDFWSNTPIEFVGIPNPVGANGNVAVDPLFTDLAPPNPIDWDLHLLPVSMLIDAGNPDPSRNDATDGSRNDIGAHGGPQNASW